MADQIRYVNTASTAGTQDGTTVTAGNSGTAAYASLVDAIADLNANKVTGDKWTIYCTGGEDNVGSTTISITGAVDATGYVLITPYTGNDHGGTWNTSVYRLKGAWLTSVLSIKAYCRVVGLQIEQAGAGNYSGTGILLVGVSSGVFVDRCIVRGTATGDGTSGAFMGVNLSYGVGAKVSNTLIYTHTKNTGDILLNVLNGGVTAYVVNCTLRNGDVGINLDSDTELTNVLFSACNTDYSGTAKATSGNNGTDDGTPQTYLSTVSASFVNAGSYDFHLTASVAGTDASGKWTPDAPASWNDIDNVARTGTWDIGADQFVAPGNPWYYYSLQ